MKKIYEIYKNKKMLFYIITLLYTEIITEFCASFFLYLLNRTMPSFGNPGRYAELTSVCIVICVILLTVFSCLIMVPLIWITVKSKGDDVRNQQIFLLWGTVVIAGVLGVFLAGFGFTPSYKAAEILADFLNQKFGFFITNNHLTI